MEDKLYNPKALEQKILNFWNKIKLLEKMKEAKRKSKKFYFLDGPPYVNDVSHVGNTKTTIMKDILAKFKLMQGFDVWLQPGFDCHGLPVETKVEKDLGIKSKSQIEEMGIEKFMDECLKKVLNNEKNWAELYKLLGAWRGWFEPYLTYKNYYIESGWWTIKKLHEKGMLVEGEKPIFWCWRCETALSGYEVTDSYADLTDPGIYVKFRVKGNEYLLVYTTTPWTLFGNVAIAANPREQYIKIKVEDETYILAEKRLKPVFDELLHLKYEVLERFKGEELDGLKYESILDVPSQKGIEHRIVLSIPIMKYKKYKKHRMGAGKEEEEFAEFVTTEEGTGLVHTAPGHGSTDAEMGKYYNLSFVSPVDEKGILTKDAGLFAGMFVKDADEKIIEELRKSNSLLYSGKIVHSYPVCWRCKSPLIYRNSKQWFLKVDPIKDKMIKENEDVRWLPDFAQKRFHNWLIDAIDWCISQQRYWGIPLPVWICQNCGRKLVIGSEKELRKNSKEKLPKEINLHRHVVDKIYFNCDCGGKMKRVPDILNVWFDSGIAPWASLGYPAKNKELFDKLWPVDLIMEAQDQIRGWFYSLMFCGVSVFDESPYKSVGMIGWVLDEKGEKMSKSLGNVIWTSDAIENLGSDVLRMYYCWEIPPWEIQNFSMKTAEEIRRALNILWNSYLFFKTYSKASKWKSKSLKKLEKEDSWILSRVNSLTAEVEKNIENFELHLAGRSIVNFILEDFSRWYVKLVKDRTWPTYKGKDKDVAFATLYCVLDKLIKILAPICPFISEEIYQNLFFNKVSIHLENWPKTDKKLINKRLEKQMELAKAIIEASNSARQEKNIKLKYPLYSLTVDGDKQVLQTAKNLKAVIARIANVKEVKTAKIKEGKEFKVGKLVLETKVDAELKKEWLLKELIRAVQDKRKKLGLKVTDEIKLYLPDIFKSFEKIIKEETGSKPVFGKIQGEREEFEFENEKYEFGVEK